MNVQAIHNLIRLEVNKINSQLNFDFEPDEIDDIFNRLQTIHINNIFSSKGNIASEGYEMGQVRKSHLLPLVVEDYTDIVFNTGTKGKKLFILPSDFMFYINSSVSTYFNNCGSIEKTTVTSGASFYLIPMNTNITVLDNFQIKTTATNTLLYSNTKPYITSKDMGFLVDDLINTILNDYSIYWESIKSNQSLVGIYNVNCIIIQATNGSAEGIKYTFDGINYITPSRITKTSTYDTPISGGTSRTYSTIERTFGEIQIDLNNSFRKPIPEEPLITVFNNFISLYIDDNSVVTGLSLSYLRKPKKISLSLQRDCELPDEVVQNIISECVTHLKAISESPAYQYALNEDKKLTR